MKIEVYCMNCNKVFLKAENQIRRTNNHNFCSSKCSVSLNRGIQNHPPKIWVCKKCGGNYRCTKKYRSIAYCEPCRSTITSDMYKFYTLEQIHSSLHLKGKHPSWANAEVRRFNRYWNKNLLKLPCAYCSYNSHVELHHKKPISEFPETATLGEVNHPSNIIQLCPNHHWELDHGLIQLP